MRVGDHAGSNRRRVGRTQVGEGVAGDGVVAAFSSARPAAAHFRLSATLNAGQEVPKQVVKNQAGHGTFTGSLAGTKLTWKLTWAKLHEHHFAGLGYHSPNMELSHRARLSRKANSDWICTID